MRTYRLIWDSNNLTHLWESHRVSPDDIDEAINGVAGENVHREVRRDGDYLIFYGETGDGRLLVMVAEEIDGALRVFGARDMDRREKRVYRAK